MSMADDDLGFDLDAAVDEMMEGVIDGVDAPVDELETAVSEAVEEADAGTGEPTAPVAPADPAAKAEPADGAGDEAPRTWKPEAAAKWAALDPAIKAEIQRREADMFRGIEQYKGEASIGRGVRKFLEPYREILERDQIDPMMLIGNLVSAHAKLSLGQPHERVELFQRLMMDYGVSLEQLGGLVDIPRPDPAVSALQNNVAQLSSRIDSYEAIRRDAQRAEISQQIQTFASDPAHPYFNELSDDITGLIKGGVCRTLQEAYDRAVWSNPATRAKEQARLQTAQAEAARKEAAEKAKTARQATATNVRSTATRGSAAAPVGSLSDTIDEVFAQLKGAS